MNYNTKHGLKGWSLIEIMLVLVIGAAILMLGISQYYTYRKDTDAREVQYNVEALFQAMANFYRANCFGAVNPGGGFIPGRLYPETGGKITQFIVLDVQKDLVDPGFLASNDARRLRSSNPFIDARDGYYGYIVQFNRAPDMDRLQCVQNSSGGPATGPTADKNCDQNIKIGTIVRWQAQVAIRLSEERASGKINYKHLFVADCLSDWRSDHIQPCSSVMKGDFVVWERSPLAAIKDENTLSQTAGNLAQFKQMYTTYPMTYLTTGNPSGSIPSSTGGTQLFLCGG